MPLFHLVQAFCKLDKHPIWLCNTEGISNTLPLFLSDVSVLVPMVSSFLFYYRHELVTHCLLSVAILAC